MGQAYQPLEKFLKERARGPALHPSAGKSPPLVKRSCAKAASARTSKENSPKKVLGTRWLLQDEPTEKRNAELRRGREERTVCIGPPQRQTACYPALETHRSG